MDTDGDGVPDGLDKCPNTKRPSRIDADGCVVPEPRPAEPEIFKGKASLVLEGVTFETSSAKLTAGARDVLMKVTASLKEYPDLKVEVSGHTDSTGDESYNWTLSQGRADAVRAFLVEQGANGASLTAKGYGSGMPVGDNGTREGRAMNRRVELKKLDQ